MNEKRQVLRGQRVLVTGASSGIGAATVELLAAEGMRVGLHFHRNKTAALALVDRIKASGGQAEPFEADLLRNDARERLVPEAIERLGGLDGLVNNAGAAIGAAPVLELSPCALRDTWCLNAEVPFLLSQAAMRYMRDAGGGRIVNISSIGVKFGGSSRTLHYAAAKAALETMTLGLAKAGASHGIRINAIRPGVIKTSIHADKTPEEWKARVDLIPLKREGMPIDIARMVLYLLSPGGDFITGQVFAVSGGE